MILFTLTILVYEVISQCSDRTSSQCLKDEFCQITQKGCQNRPILCEQIDATNPNNCSGTNCYYDFERRICQSYVLNSRLLEGGRDTDGRTNEESENQDTQENQMNHDNQDSQQHQNNSNDSTQQQSQQNNSENSGIPPSSTNDVTQSNGTSDTSTSASGAESQPKNNTAIDYSTQDTVVFEIVEFDINIEDLVQQREGRKQLTLTSSSIVIISLLINHLLSI